MNRDAFALRGRAGPALMEPVSEPQARSLAGRLAGIDPWKTLGFSGDRMLALILAPDAQSFRTSVVLDGVAAGIVAVRYPWLRGPYLQLLGLLPFAQGRGIGRAIVAEIGRKAAEAGTANVWTCASDFNLPARQFYERCGFRVCSEIEGLLAPGRSELLMRLRL